MLKKGDKVKSLENNIDVEEYVNKTGIIIEVCDMHDDFPYLVRFDHDRNSKIWCEAELIK